MIEACKMDPFKKGVYDEFEGNCQHVLGVSGDRVREVLLERGHDIFEEFEAAFEFAGAAFMRQSMSWRLCALEQVYHETKIGRELTDDEQLERFTNWIALAVGEMAGLMPSTKISMDSGQVVGKMPYHSQKLLC